MEIDKLLEKLSTYNLPQDNYVLAGSAPLAIRKIRNAQDLDIVVTDSLWKQLSGKYPVTYDSFLERIILQEGMDILGKGSMFEDDNIATTEKMIKTADFFEGHRFLNLKLLKAFKLKMGREKDLKDIELIDQYLASQGPALEAKVIF